MSLRSCDSETEKISVSTGSTYQVVGRQLELSGTTVIATLANLELTEQVIVRAAQSGVWYALNIVEATRD